MARAAVQRRLTWLRAGLLHSSWETPRVRRLVFDVAGWPGHLAGQHVDVRLTAEDGYTAQRSYSVASAPEEEHLHLLVERFDGGEVSPYLTDDMRPGDELELRGPIGGYFVWSADPDREEREDGVRPVQLIAGGAGVAPFLAMLDHHRNTHSATPIQLLYSVRTLEDVLGQGTTRPHTQITLTRGAPPDWAGRSGRIDGDMLQDWSFGTARRPRTFVCGPTAFVEVVATTLVDLGHDPAWIRLERFGDMPGPA
jgi:ferredoxin-NADP reductase